MNSKRNINDVIDNGSEIQNDTILSSDTDVYHYTEIQKAIISDIDDKINNAPFYKAFTFNTKIDIIDLGDGRSRRYRSQSLTPRSGLDHRVIDGIWRTYSKFYGHLASQLTEHAFRKGKAHLLPLTYDWIDLDGTRGKGKPDYQNFPHIHSVWLIHLDIEQKWTDLISQDFKLVESFNSGVERTWSAFRAANGWEHASPSVESFEAKEIYDLPRWVEYASKFYEKVDKGAPHQIKGMKGKTVVPVRDDYLLYSQQPLSTTEREGLKYEREEIVEAKREGKKLWAEMTKQNPQLEGWWAS
jgi:hypothetical protein